VIAWNRVHYEGAVDEVVDVHHFWNFDGSFINAQGMTGTLKVRHCDVGDAFNGVHLFNTEFGRIARLDVTGCRFTRIRDNAIEVEGVADGSSLPKTCS
jgi:hypothetical protein